MIAERGANEPDTPAMALYRKILDKVIVVDRFHFKNHKETDHYCMKQTNPTLEVALAQPPALSPAVPSSSARHSAHRLVLSLNPLAQPARSAVRPGISRSSRAPRPQVIPVGLEDRPVALQELMEGENSESSEQLFRWMGRLKHIINEMALSRATFFIHRMVWIHNERTVEEASFRTAF
jgi:hypothetical protein